MQPEEDWSLVNTQHSKTRRGHPYPAGRHTPDTTCRRASRSVFRTGENLSHQTSAITRQSSQDCDRRRNPPGRFFTPSPTRSWTTRRSRSGGRTRCRPGIYHFWPPARPTYSDAQCLSPEGRAWQRRRGRRMIGAIIAFTSRAIFRAIPRGAVRSAPLLMTPCGSSVPVGRITVLIFDGTTSLNSIQLMSAISRVVAAS